MLFDLPLHPLLVHLPVVLLPLTAVGVIGLALTQRRSRALALSVLGLLVVGTLAAVGSLLSGNALAGLSYTPAQHQRWGLILTIAAVIYALVAGPWLWRASREDGGSPAKPWGYASAAVGAAVAVLTVLVGHSGAEAVWEGKTDTETTVAPASPNATSVSPAAPSTPAPSSPSSSEASGYTMEEVAKHNTAESCWVAINGNAYDLTEWIGNHPGGSQAIQSMCGTDGTAAFKGKHGGEEDPAAALERYRLGPIR